MEECRSYVEKILNEDVHRIIFSSPAKSDTDYRRIEIQKNGGGYQAEKRTEKQVFHENFGEEDLLEKCVSFIETKGFRQMNAFSTQSEQSLKISKKGKILYHRHRCVQPVKEKQTHNRQKKYRLMEGTVVPPLVDMGVFTADGKVVPSMYDKYRQINKFLQFIEEAVDKAGLQKLHIIDFGCGKSYLTFVVYYFLVYVKQVQVEMIGLDLKEGVIEKCNAAAEKYGYDHLKFEVGNIAGYQPQTEIDMVISLHACNTATDFALFNAITWKAKMIISVPCCQQELCAQMDSETLPIVQRYGIIKERTAALMTDAIRANLLEYCGYKTQVLEFVDLSHTPKNLLLRAVRSNISKSHKKQMQQEVEALCECFSFEPTLRNLLKEAGIYEL
ncbi:MAG: class I SAM-dependent methyltransferase [Lachnospiraceae bacterium]